VTGKLVLENLKHQPMRSLLSFLLIGVPVNLILCLVGLSHGMLEDSQNRARGIGADIVIRGSASTAITSASGVTIPEKLTEWATGQPHVAMSLGVVVKLVEFPLNVMGVDLAEFNRMNGGFRFVDGSPRDSLGPDEILVDDLYASQKQKRVGDTVHLMNRDWRIAGIIGGGKLARLVVQKQVLQELEAATGKVSAVYVKLDDPKRAPQVVEHLRQNLPTFQINTMDEYTAMFSATNVAGVREFIYVIMGIGVVIGFFVVCLSMYMAVLQRTREIGILKSLGASNSFVIRIILSEALVLGIGGTVLGILMSFVSWWLLGTLVPASIPMVIVPGWWPIAGLIALSAAVLGGLYPGMKAARHDPIQALAYE
jgi:putative ABC transport system permease protein